MAYHKCASIYGTNNSTASVQTASGAIANFNTKLAMPIKSLEIDANAKQEAGTPTPQSPKAISGVSAVNVIHCGKNMFDINYLTASGITIQDGVASGKASSFSFNLLTATPNIQFKANTQYTLKYKAYTEQNEGSTGVGLYWVIKYTDGTQTTNTCSNSDTTYTEHTVTSTAGKTISLINFSYSSLGNNVWHLTDIQLEEGASATTYEPYNGNAYNILFPPYPENLPYFEGLLAGTHDFVDLGDLAWTYNSTNTRFDTGGLSGSVQWASNVVAHAICPKYKTVTFNALYGGEDKTCAFDSRSLRIRDSSYSDAASFKNSMSGIYLIYELAEPKTPTITPEQYETLLRAFAGVYYGGRLLQDKDGHRRFEVTHNIFVLDSLFDIGVSDYEGNDRFVIRAFADVGKVNTNFLASHYVMKSQSSVLPYMTMSSAAPRMWITYAKSEFLSNVDAFKTYLDNQKLNGTPIQIAFELATPYYIDLPDGEPITTFIGTNNIYADSGDTKVSYKKLI